MFRSAAATAGRSAGRLSAAAGGRAALAAAARPLAAPPAPRARLLYAAAQPPPLQKYILGVLVHNEAGVLARVSGMFAARGYNIDSLVVGRTEVPDLSRMTIVVYGDQTAASQILKQLNDIVPVVVVERVSTDADGSGANDGGVTQRDLMLIKVDMESLREQLALLQLGNVFEAKVVHIVKGQVTFELSGHPDKIERFIEMAEPYGIVEIARTGVVGMSRGTGALSHLIQDGQLVDQTHIDSRAKLAIDDTALPPG